MADLIIDTTSNTISSGTGGITIDPASTETVTINNGVFLPDGTAADPSITFADDTNTGIYSSSNDTVNIAAHGVEQVRFTGVASAVNQIELKASATGNALEVNALGSDTDISVNVVPKGAGTLQVGGTSVSLSTHDHSGVYEPADATILKDADIGVSVQAYDSTILVDADIGVNVAAQSHNHDSDYISIVSTPTLDNFVKLTAGGELVDAAVSASSFATAGHNHDASYAALSHVHEGTTIDATAVTDGYVLTADGAGNAAWEAVPAGGLTDIVDDTTPQLGGSLDVNGQKIVSVSNGNIDIEPNGTGNVLLGNFTFDADQTVGAGEDGYVMTYDNGTGLISLEAAAGGGSDSWGSTSGSAHWAAYPTTPAAVASVGTGANQLALGDGATVSGTGTNATAIGKSYTGSSNTVAIGIGNNGASYGATGTGTVSIGASSKATTSYSIGIGFSAFCTSYGGVAIGGSCIPGSGNYTIGIGYNVTSSGSPSGSVMIGYSAKAFNHGESIRSNGYYTSQGDCSSVRMFLRAKTTDATPTEMLTNAGGGAGTYRAVLPNDSSVFFKARIIARRTDANDETAAYTLEGVIDRNGTAATTALVGSITKTVVAEDTAAWDVDATADTTNGALKITVTGEAAKTILWYCDLEMQRVFG